MKKIKLGIIGTGSVVREIYQYFYFKSDYSDLISVEAICDSNTDNMQYIGDEYGISPNKRFSNYREMISKVKLDTVAVNTPDSFHKEPIIYALEAGLDILVPKPMSETIIDAHEIIERAKKLNRFIGVDFHKREDPRIKEAKTRYNEGIYGIFQTSVWYMLDKLMVSDPNHKPRFFATPDFSVKNTPVSFLTVHMIDAFINITGLKPVKIKAVGFKHKLPSLTPISVDGYDTVDTEITFEQGGVCHIITGWAIPNSAHSLTVQSARIIGSEGVLDLNIDKTGYHEILSDGIFERNPLFRNFESNGNVSGYGMRSPGKIIKNIIRFRNNEMSSHEFNELMSPFELGFFTTIVCEAAHHSLALADESFNGVITGKEVDIKELLTNIIGIDNTENYYGNSKIK